MTGRPHCQISVDRSVDKVLERLPRNLRQRLWGKIDSLGDDPRPRGCVALKGHELYRVRAGDWRIIYQVRDKALRVLVVDVGPSGGVYEDL
ncbi:MAG TPA: type II toxin-antitoxin system RelE/ParE family toxin [Anaerolineae bacterium]|nr:type II toxin-antitoxin system RelE/ParE family toxin [Anaerolineae bacterium]HOR01055.1 type II toxin-antitoxin system RelE/ParE family toxin [Anaerolineae bacterium]HPL27094.1 type II toxin-antitoxin system RelE/ParE family toxin [Anaerolineae bacterium]